jgi:hypothetical protein
MKRVIITITKMNIIMKANIITRNVITTITKEVK